MSEEYRLKLIETLQKAPLTNIPEKLRELADKLDKGEAEADNLFITYFDNLKEDLVVIGYGGDCPASLAHYYFSLACSFLLRC